MSLPISRQEMSQRPVRGPVRRLALFAGLLLLLECAFWFLVDFQQFHPACDGPFLERAMYAGLTATGPFAMAINGHFTDLATGLVIECGVIVMFVAIAILKRKSIVASGLGYFGVVLWFFFGFAVAGLRIT